MLAVKLDGGLGNQLFQLAAAESIANEAGYVLSLQSLVSPETSHSRINYFSNVFEWWNDKPLLPDTSDSFREVSFNEISGNLRGQNVLLTGYFQNWRYIPPSFIGRLKLPRTPRTYSVFLHIRGGDYIWHSLHDVKLYDYYCRAINLFPPGTHFDIFTDHIQYAKSMDFLGRISHTFIEADEITSISMMASCAAGICANSTFSWWGAYLNPNRMIVMPDKWYNDCTIPTKGYYFPGVIKCPV
jgi:hypothetical protein